jgi:hypothetical protein
MRLRLYFLIGLITAVSGLLFWRNSARYPSKSVWWRTAKSIIELALVLGTALRIPVVLISWCILWFTRPAKTPWIKVTLGALAGIALGFISAYMLELLILIAVFAVDDITGEDEGFLANLRKAKQEDQGNGQV